nr:hypothetical protein [Tanacetum cinerariifolium]
MDDEGAKKKAKESQVAGDDQVKGRQAEIYQIDMDHASKVLSMQEDEPEVQEVVDVVTTAKLITEVVTVTSESVNAASTTIVAITKPMKKKQQVEMDEEYARKLHEELNKDIDWNVAIDHEENEAIQSINETPAQKAAKRRKLNKEVEDLKQHLEIVPDENDDVYTEATPLARKVLVVDYEIIHFNNKPHYKIIRVNGTHQLYVSFITLLKKFNREDLESLWRDQMDKLKSGRIKGLSMVKQGLRARMRLRMEEESEMSLELLSFGVDAAMDPEENTTCLMLLVKNLVLLRKS